MAFSEATKPKDSSKLKERFAIVQGKITDGSLQRNFESFVRSHDEKIIDWNVTQDSHSSTWVIFIRYRT